MSSVKQILATKDIKVSIGGKDYECLLIPSPEMVDVDYRNCPEDHPKIRKLMDKVRRGEDI